MNSPISAATNLKIETASVDSVSLSGVTRQLAGQSALLMIGNAFTMLVGFPFQIYIARELGAQNLGVFGLFEVTVQTISALLGFGAGNVATRFLPEYLAESRFRHVRHLVFLIFAVVGIISLLTALSVLACGQAVLDYFDSKNNHGDLVVLVALMTPVGMLLGTSQQVLRGFFDIRYIVLISSFLQLTLKIAFTVLFFSFGLPLNGYILAVILSSTLALVCLLWGVWRNVSRLPNSNVEVGRDERSRWLAYAKIMYGTSVLSMATAPLERFLLAATLDVASVGVIVVVRSITQFSQIFLQVIVTVISPLFVSAKNSFEVQKLYQLSVDWLFRLSIPVLLFTLFFASDILHLYGSSFSTQGTIVLAVFTIAQAVNLICGPIGAVLNMRGQEKAMFAVWLIADLANLLLIGTLIPLLGIYGAAVAYAFPIIFNNLIAVRIANRQLGISWRSRKYWKWVVPTLTFIVTMIAWRVLSESTLPAWRLAIALVVSFSVFQFVYFWLGLDEDDGVVFQVVREKFLRLIGRSEEKQNA